MFNHKHMAEFVLAFVFAVVVHVAWAMLAAHGVPLP